MGHESMGHGLIRHGLLGLWFNSEWANCDRAGCDRNGNSERAVGGEMRLAAWGRFGGRYRTSVGGT